MVLTQAHRTLVERTKSVGAAKEAEPLSDGDCIYLLSVIGSDLGLLGEFPEFAAAPIPEFFGVDLKHRPSPPGDFWELFERLLAKDANSDTFFSCLGALYKARLKYSNILSRQPLPTMEQVGPRGLLQ